MMDISAQETVLAATLLCCVPEVKIVFVSSALQVLVTEWRVGQSPNNLPLKQWLEITSGQYEILQIDVRMTSWYLSHQPEPGLCS